MKPRFALVNGSMVIERFTTERKAVSAGEAYLRKTPDRSMRVIERDEAPVSRIVAIRTVWPWTSNWSIEQ